MWRRRFGSRSIRSAIWLTRQDRDARRREFDRQRHPVEPGADPAHAVSHAGRVGIERDRSPSRARSMNSATAPSSAGSRGSLARMASVERGRRRRAPGLARPARRGRRAAGGWWRSPAATASARAAPTTSSAQPSTTCSQLSSTSRVDSGSLRASAAGTGSPLTSRLRIVAATTWVTRPSSNVVDRSIHHAPPTKSARIASASATANRVLPAPPGPHRVRTRVRHTSDRSSRSAASRPTSLVSWTGRFPSASSRCCSLVSVAVSSISRAPRPRRRGRLTRLCPHDAARRPAEV